MRSSRLFIVYTQADVQKTDKRRNTSILCQDSYEQAVACESTTKSDSYKTIPDKARGWMARGAAEVSGMLVTVRKRLNIIMAWKDRISRHGVVISR